MAFRIEAAACLIFAGLLPAQNLKYEVRHEHARKGGEGVLVFDPDGVYFEESGKKKEHSRRWQYHEIQQLELSPARLRILTYEDARWQLGRDREYTFDHVPENMAAELFPVLSKRLDQRFVAAVADPAVVPLWTIPAKMLSGRSGSSGLLKMGADRIVFESKGASRTWRYGDIQGITSEGPHQLSVVSLDRETRFQLQRALLEGQYNSLWRRISEANGLKTFYSSKENQHD